MGKIGQLTGKREKLKNGVKLLLSMFVFGEALSPLKFSKNNAKWLLQLWTIMQLLQKKWCMVVIGDALSPLKFSTNKAKF